MSFWAEHLADPAFVYVIQGDPGTPIKVGFAKNVEARRRRLQTGNPQVLRVLLVLAGDARLEALLHRRLEGARINGEWFRPVEAFLDYVEDLAMRMRAAYRGDGAAPDYATVDRSLASTEALGVFFVDPNPKVPPEVARRMRESVRGCSRSAYLGPADTTIHQRLSPGLGTGAFSKS